MRMCDAIIAAKGSSVRVPRKNLIDIGGKPLVVQNILQAQETKQISRVWVTTEDDEIAEVSERAGARIIWRPDWMNDTHSGNEPFVDAIQQIRAVHEMDLVVLMLPTKVLRLPGDFDRLIDAYNQMPVVDGKTNRASFVIPRGDVSMYTDIGNHRCELIYNEMDDKLLEHTGGCYCSTWQEIIKFHKQMCELLGEDHPTDKAHNDFCRKAIKEGLRGSEAMPWHADIVAWVPVEWWQSRDIDIPSDVEEMREAWDAFMPKDKT